MKSKKSYVLIAALCVLLMNLSLPMVLADTPWLHTEGSVLKDPMGNTVVLRGVDTIDIGSTELWFGGAINMIDRLTDKTDAQGASPGWYTKVVRIAVYPSDAEDYTSPLTFIPGDDNFYNTVLRPVVDFCKSKDVYAIIDCHYVANTYDHVDMANQFWTYMAQKFANDSHVIFELFQEPINPGTTDDARWLSVRTDMQNWYNIVRTYAPNNLILVGGPSWSQIIGPAADYPLTGNNIAMVCHTYPYHWGVAPAGNNSFTASIEKCLTRYPVFMSEWGFWSDSGDEIGYGSILNYGLPITNFCEARKMSHTAWVASHDWMPPMFYPDGTLRIGMYEMGGFVKDRLYAKRNDDQPVGTGENHPPTCSIYSPAGGGSINAGSSVTIQADATDDGAISKVEFFQGSTKIGEDTTAPYAYTWNNVSQGTYNITAKATDNDNAPTTSAPVTLNVIAGAFPSPWISADVGGPDMAGYTSYSGGVFTTEADGLDIWDTWDRMHFVYQPVSTNVEIIARVVSVENTNPWAKAGVMIRSSLNGNSVNVFMQVTPVNGKMLTSRSHTAGLTVDSPGTGSAPLWVRIVRNGSSFTGYSSTNGTTWTNSGSVTIPMPAGTFIGLASTSHTSDALGIAVFDNVTVIAGSALTPDTTPPANPAGLGTTASMGLVQLNWNDNADSDFDYYNVYRGTTSGGPYTKINSSPVVVSDFSDTGVTDGSTYYYVVRAVDMSSNESGNCVQASATLPIDTTPPAAPTGLTSSIDYGSMNYVLLQWNNNAETDLAGYDIYRSNSQGGPYGKINPSLVTASYYIDYTVAPASAYYYVIKAVDESSNASGYSNEVSAILPSGAGTILRQYWSGIAGGTVADLTSNANYPYNPSGSSQITSFEGPSNFADTYGSRIIGYLHPTMTGGYTFYVAGDDSSELWLSTDDNPANAVKIAYNTTWVAPRNWTKYASQKSAVKNLVYGQRYFIMALHKEGTNGDNIAVAWEGPGITRQVILGGFLSPYVPSLPPTVSITSPSNGATFTAPANITINATASDSDGTVTKVDFYQGTTLLGTDMSSPYSYTWNNAPAGSYSLTAKATDNDSVVGTSAPVNIMVNPSGGATIHVDSITCSKLKSGNKWKGRAVVVIKDYTGAPVSGATVTGTFTGSYSQTLSGTTAANGSVTLTTTAAVTGTVTFNFCVTNVTKASFTYDSGANVETCDGFSG